LQSDYFPFRGLNPPKKTSIWGVNTGKHFQDKHITNQQLHIIKTTTSIPTKFCTVINNQILLVGGPNVHVSNPGWQTAAILEKNVKKNCQISATVSEIGMKFVMMSHFYLLKDDTQ